MAGGTPSVFEKYIMIESGYLREKSVDAGG